MTEIVFGNNSSALLASGITAVATTCTVDAGDGALFPSPGASEHAVCAIEDDAGNLEYVHLTSRSGDVLTILRAQEGTVGFAFALGARIEVRLTQGTMEFMVQKDAVVNSIRGPSGPDEPITWVSEQPQISGSDIATISDIPVTTAYTDTFLAAATAGAARTTLGSTAVGDALFIAASAAAARTTLGSGAIGDAVFGAATTAAAHDTLKIGDARVFWATAVGGTADAITCTIEETTALQNGDMILLVPTGDNTGAAMTLNPSSIGATAIKDAVSGENFIAGSIQTGEMCVFIYNGTTFEYGGGVVVGGEETFDVSGTLTKPSWADANAFCYMELWGGGGAGAQAVNIGYAGGGAGGAYNRALVPADEVADGATVTVGAGGVGTDNWPSGSDGGNGGDTLVVLASSGFIFADGGTGGNSETNAQGHSGSFGIGGLAGETAATYFVNANMFTETGANGGRGGYLSTQANDGGNASYSAAGGGGAGTAGAVAKLGGASLFAGDGGDAHNTLDAEDGAAPGGGGGATGYASGAIPGDGGDGKAIIKWIRFGHRSSLSDPMFTLRTAAV